MTLDTVRNQLLDELRSRPTIRAGSLITTVFGDSIAPRGGMIWLGSLIAIMAGFGVSERLVRTSVNRLANDGWLESEQRGRRAYYTLSAVGRERFRAATHRIYGTPAEAWDGYWCVLLLAALDARSRDQVRKECGWLGFGAISTNVLAHPSPNVEDLDDTLKRLGVASDVVVMTGHTVHSDDAMRRLAEGSWNLPALEQRYAEFVERFQPALDAVNKGGPVDSEVAFQLRTLLIQEYRKILLRDPQMPKAMLPAKWHGTIAYRLCRDLYRAIFEAADDYLTRTVETIDGKLPPPGGEYRGRFGGLESAA